MEKLITSNELKKELENLEIQKRKKEKSFKYNFDYMIMIGGFFAMGVLYLFLGSKYGILLDFKSLNIVNTVGCLLSFGTVVSEIALANRGKKILEEIHSIVVDIDEKKIDIIKTRQEEMKKANEMIKSAGITQSEEFVNNLIGDLINGKFKKNTYQQTGKVFLGTQEEVEKELDSYQNLLDSGLFVESVQEERGPVKKLVSNNKK